jgi:hypothetical protein
MTPLPLEGRQMISQGSPQIFILVGVGEEEAKRRSHQPRSRKCTACILKDPPRLPTGERSSLVA